MQLKSERTGAKPPGDQHSVSEAGTFIPRKKYAAILGICPRSAVRRENGDPNFPRVFFVNRRAYVVDTDLAAYQALLMRRGLCEGPAADPQRGRRPAKNPPREMEAV
jgi:hypothetical protein